MYEKEDYDYDQYEDTYTPITGGDIGDTVRTGIKSSEHAAQKYEEGFAKPVGQAVSQTIKPIKQTLAKGICGTEEIAKQYNKATNTASALGFKALLHTAEKMPSWGSWISNLFYNFNLIVAFVFDLLLVYTLPTETSIAPEPGFFVKLLLIIATYAVVNIVLNILVFTVFIPLYYKFYTNNYTNYSRFLEKSYKAYQSKFGVQFLEERGDLKNIGILAVYPVILDHTYNRTSSIEEYKKYVRDNIGNALKKIKDDENMKKNLKDIKIENIPVDEVRDYFLEMPKNFIDYVQERETFMSQSIQMWILMICAILFFIPIKYTVVDVITEPKLPGALTTGAKYIGNAAKIAGTVTSSTLNKMTTSKQSKVNIDTNTPHGNNSITSSITDEASI